MSVELIGFILYRLLHDYLHFKNHKYVKCQLKYSPSKVKEDNQEEGKMMNFMSAEQVFAWLLATRGFYVLCRSAIIFLDFLHSNNNNNKENKEINKIKE